MQENTKKAVAEMLRQQVEHAGSQQKWARKHNVSGATVSNVLAGKWNNIANPMWQRLAAAVRFMGSEWQVAHTVNYRAVQGWCLMAQSRGMSLALSHDAGAGKTFAMVQYAEAHKNAYYIQCAEYWTKKLFLANIYRALGKDPAQLTTPELADGIIETLRQQDRPLLILDEVDKLRDVLLMFFIELYNRLDGVCGFFLAGAPYLAIAWEKGAKRDKRGFREIYSRIGRRFLHMNKVGRKDVQMICAANGVQDEAQVNAIWNEVEQQPDLRRVKREVVKLLMDVQMKAA